MKKIFVLIIIITTNVFSQIPNNKSLITDMSNFYNKEKIEKLELLTSEILSGKYGSMDDELKFYALSYSTNVFTSDAYTKKDPQKGYDKAIELIEFVKVTKYNVPNKDAYLKSMIDFMPEYIKKYPNIETAITNKNNSNTQDTLTASSNTEDKTSTSDNKTVTLTVSGSGKTLEEARLNALRSAIEQAFGTFISSKTEILNDIIVKDEIVSVTNGNIQKYDVISQVEVPNVGYVLTLTAIVSIEKLTSFAESKGVIVEFKGGMFALNVKLQKIQEASELIAIKNICKSSYDILKNSIEFNIVVKDPKVIGNNIGFREGDFYLGNINYAKSDKSFIYDYNYSEKYGTYIDQYSINDFFVDFEITLKSNTNFNNFADFFEKSIKSIAISEEEAESRKSLTNQGGIILINGKKYFLRNTASIYILNQFVIKSNYIPYFFKIKSNLRDYPFVYKYQYYTKPVLKLFDMPNWIKGPNGESINYSDFLNSHAELNMLKKYSDKIELKSNELNNFLEFKLEPKKYVFFIREYFKLNEIETIDKFEIQPVDIEGTIDKEKQRISKTKRVKILNAYGTYPQVYYDFFGRSYKYGNKFDFGNEVDDNGRYVELIEIKNKIAMVKIYNAEFQRDSTDNNGYEFTFRRTNKPGELFYIPVEWISDKPVKNNFSENERPINYEKK